MRQSLKMSGLPSPRTAVFWLHLVAGVAAGLVILLMSVTGVALTYEKQMLEWADRRQAPSVPLRATDRSLPPSALLAAAAAALPGALPTGLIRRADPRAPATITFAGGRALLVDPYRAVVVGEPSPELRAFFRAMTSWHRWLAREGAHRPAGKLVTGVANLAFLLLVLSGFYLWMPRVWSRMQFTQVLWFRRGLPGRARDFNWHNVIGIWSALPLAIVAAGAAPISFPWAGTLVYRLVGEAAPSTPARTRRAEAAWADVRGVDAAWARAEAHEPRWRAISLRLGGPGDAPYTFVIDRGYGGQPQKRGTLTVDRVSAAVVTWETFDDLSTGRRLRSWLRFAHTGEYYGLAGQTIAGLASAGGAVLVYTGLALAWRRGRGWQRRRSVTTAARKVA